jgi:hypothetical protein
VAKAEGLAQPAGDKAAFVALLQQALVGHPGSPDPRQRRCAAAPLAAQQRRRPFLTPSFPDSPCKPGRLAALALGLLLAIPARPAAPSCASAPWPPRTPSTTAS